MKRSKFSLSHYNLLSCDMGELIPCGLTEVIPGDTIQQATSALVRVTPLLSPVMHPVHVRIHHWYVPHRIIWPEFEQFITGGPDGMDDTEFPTISIKPDVGTLADYLGVPTDLTTAMEVSALPFRAYNLIYNEWYRDQDLLDPLAISKESGVDTTTSTALQRIAWEKDYFTSARPWDQKGPTVTVPFSGTANLAGTGTVESQDMTWYARGANAGTNPKTATVNSPAQKDYFEAPRFNPGSSQTFSSQDATLTGRTLTNAADIAAKLNVDMSSVSAVNIIALREAFAMQRYEEARARYGSRYTEYLRYLGVRSSDARLQRPEYLGGGKQTIQFSEVLQTAPGEEPGVGSMYGHGIAAMRSNRYRRFIEEHGYVITMLSVKPKTIYTQGLQRTWNRRTKEDFFQKELQHIGQQEILNKELYAKNAQPDGVFGFQDRYDDYRRAESRVSGEFRTSMLDYWDFARTFANEPVLNGDFVSSTPTKRTFAEQTQDSLYIMANHSIQVRRMLSKTGSSFIY